MMQTMEIYEHFHANDWDDVITFKKPSQVKSVFGRNPWHSTELSQLEFCFVGR